MDYLAFGKYFGMKSIASTDYISNVSSTLGNRISDEEISFDLKAHLQNTDDVYVDHCMNFMK